MDIDYPDKRKFCKKIGCSISAKSALFLTESQKRRGNEFGRRAWVLAKTPGFNEFVGRPKFKS